MSLTISGISIAVSAFFGFIPYLLHRNDKKNDDITISVDLKEGGKPDKATDEMLKDQNKDEYNQRYELEVLKENLLASTHEIT
jgi:hypothetical protein